MNKELKQRIEQINAGTAPAGYKKTKVGIVPVEWEVRRLSEISTELTERAGDREFETLSISAGIGFVNQANKFGKELSGKQYEKYIVLHRGDFSYNKGNSKKYPQGCIYMLRDRDAAAVPNVFESFRLNSGVNSFFEQLFISGFLNQQLFAKINHGVRDDGLLNLRGEDFYKCRVAVPTLPEQQKIAETLMAQDAVIALMQKQIELKQQRKKGLMQKLLSGEMRVGSGEWQKRKIKEFCRTSSGTTPSRKEQSNFQGDILWLSSGELKSKYVFDSAEKISEQAAVGMRVYEAGTVVIAIYGLEAAGIRGTCSIIQSKCTISQACMAFTDFDGIINEFFYYWYLWQGQIIGTKYAQGTKQQNLSSDIVDNILVNLPSLPEQEKIAEILSAQDNEIELLQQQLALEQQKKKALMQLLLTGKVRVKT